MKRVRVPPGNTPYAGFALEFPKRPEHIGLRFQAANRVGRWQAALGLIMVRLNNAGN